MLKLMTPNTLTESSLEQLLTDPIYHQRIERIARKSTRNLPLSWEDAAQTAHMRVIQSAKRGKFHHGGFREFYYWAMAVAHNAIVDVVRREYYRSHLSLSQTGGDGRTTLLEQLPDPHHTWDSIERADLVVKVRAAIAELDCRYPARRYGLLWSSRVEGLTQAQIAVKLNLSQSAVSKRWREMVTRVVQHLGLVSGDSIQPQIEENAARYLTPSGQQRLRERSHQSW